MDKETGVMAQRVQQLEDLGRSGKGTADTIRFIAADLRHRLARVEAELVDQRRKVAA